MTTRRALLATTLGAAAFALAACQTTASLPPGTTIGAIRVDVSRLAELGVGPRAGVIKTRLEQELARSIPTTGQPGATTLNVAVRGLTLSTFVGGDVDDGTGSDYLDSVVTLTSPSGQVLATYPLLSSNGSGDAGVWYDANLVDKRVERVVVNHALWIKRYVGR